MLLSNQNAPLCSLFEACHSWEQGSHGWMNRPFQPQVWSFNLSLTENSYQDSIKHSPPLNILRLRSKCWIAKTVIRKIFGLVTKSRSHLWDLLLHIIEVCCTCFVSLWASVRCVFHPLFVTLCIAVLVSCKLYTWVNNNERFIWLTGYLYHSVIMNEKHFYE